VVARLREAHEVEKGAGSPNDSGLDQDLDQLKAVLESR